MLLYLFGRLHRGIMKLWLPVASSTHFVPQRTEDSPLGPRRSQLRPTRARHWMGTVVSHLMQMLYSFADRTGYDRCEVLSAY